MSQNVRKAQPDCLRYFLTVLRCPDATGDEDRIVSCNVEQLVSTLIKLGKYSPSTAQKTVYNAISDGLLMPVNGPRSRPSTAEIKSVRLPNLEEVREEFQILGSHDWYCYECHLPGILEHCTQCWRSFHRLCFRKDPRRPNYLIPSDKDQRAQIPTFSSEVETMPHVENTPASTNTDTVIDNSVEHKCDTVDIQANVTVNENSQTEPKPLIDDWDCKTKVDVLCLGQTRPPNRIRSKPTALNVSYKNEVLQTNEEEEEIELCTSCRLMKKARENTPPNRQPDELNFLIGLTYYYNRAWLCAEVHSHMKLNRTSPNDIKFVNSLLLYSPIKRMADIDKKLKKQEYRWLTEFLIDLLDMQHNITVFFGNYSAEADSTKWMLRDVSHDLNEIRMCPDCFRYSHEKNSSVWFAKPCVRRHELVYAKHSKFSYWPAKIVQFVTDNKFDVRFFGGDHSRALIDVRNIKPIDSDVKSLKLGKSKAITNAMDELRLHQTLNAYPPSAFSFHSNAEDVVNILRTVLGPDLKLLNFGRSKGRKRKKVVQNTANQPSTVCRGLKVSVKRLKPNDIINASLANSDNNSSPRSIRSLELHTSNQNSINVELANEIEELRKIKDEYIKKIEKLEVENRKLLEYIHRKRMDEQNSKRKKCCYMCLREATLICCCSAAYCSEICQTRHWYDGHNKNCKKI